MSTNPEGPTGPANPGSSEPAPGAPGKIRHSTPLGADPPANRGGPGDLTPLPVEASSSPPGLSPKIRALGEKKRHEDEWSRTPNTTGTGAIHVKTFHSKLTDDALGYMDRTINEWLDAHPQYEVKFVNSTVGILTGKLKEPHLVCQVWV